MRQKMMCKNYNLDFVNINAYTKFGDILSICFEDIELKRERLTDNPNQSGAITIKDDDNIKKLLPGCHPITKEDFQTHYCCLR